MKISLQVEKFIGRNSDFPLNESVTSPRKMNEISWGKSG